MATTKMSAAGEKTRSKTRKASSDRSNTGTAGGAALFVALRKILQRHAAECTVVRDQPGDYSLETRKNGPTGKPLFFGAVRTGRSDTSFHLNPVSTDPELLEAASDALRDRLQGKSSFVFKTTEPLLFEELAALTARCFESWKSAGKI
jgi:hypothetical protein